MARYIDAELLMKEFEVDTSKQVMDVSDLVFGAVTSIIEKQPTADVEEVVRCKDCKHFAYGVCTNDFALNLSRADDFCSYGGRRDT